MNIAFIEIQNFRKLKSCHIDLSEKTTIFVGANNSGKTSAMEALIRFLKERSKFSYTDFTLTNWKKIETIGNSWTPGSDAPTDINLWADVLPCLDIWFNSQLNELQYVSDIVPTLSWAGGLIGVRLRLEPKDIQALFKDYCDAIADSVNLKQASGCNIKSLPQNLREFLNGDGNISKYFQVASYLLDPAKVKQPNDGVAEPQPLPANTIQKSPDILNGLVKIDIINAQRGFSDANSTDPINENSSARSLSSQLKYYYKKHINPMDKPDVGDIQAIQSIEDAQVAFDQKLSIGFKDAFSELQNLGYPGFSDPQITLSSKIQPIEGLDHATAVQYDVVKGGSSELRLPEKLNGLGYQNLVSMVFKLILFRDEWMKVGKLKKNSSGNLASDFEPIHLVLVEEPEAHLHAQVQQVFINKAYNVLRNHPDLGDRHEFVTQMVITTHSSHIAHECDFSELRYFRRDSAVTVGMVPTVQVVNLKEIFGKNDQTSKFVTRYLKTTHCDLFFADAVILVEGQAERILLPSLIRTHHKALTVKYITILEIGGSHAHRLRPLIEALGIITLVITDLDAVDALGKPTLPEPGKALKTGNTSLETWIPKKTFLDDLYSVTDVDKISSNEKVRIAYQIPFEVDHNSSKNTVHPYTFEDAIILSNLEKLKTMSASKGLMKLSIDCAKSITPLPKICKDIFEKLQTGSNIKAEFALELLFADVNDSIELPNYIQEGLVWLEEKLK